MKAREGIDCGAHRWGPWNEVVDYDEWDEETIPDLGGTTFRVGKGTRYLVGKFRICCTPSCGGWDEKKIPRHRIN